MFPDISEHQPYVDWFALRKITDVIACRITYGTRLDHYMPVRRDTIRQAKFVAVIWYVFLRPDMSAQDQLHAATQAVPSLLPGEAIFVDFESDLSGGRPSVALRDEFCHLADAYYNQTTGIYASASVMGVTQTARPQWIAAYGTVEPNFPHVAWQFTDRQAWTGIGKCDASVVRTDAATFAHWIAPNKSTITSIEISEDLSMAHQIRATISLGPDGKGYVDVNTPHMTVLGAPSLNSSDPGPGGTGYPPPVVLSHLAVGNVTRVVAVGGLPNTVIGINLTVV